MMFGMTANQIRQAAHRDRVVVCRPVAGPRSGFEVAKELDRGAANDSEFTGEFLHRDVGMTRMFGPEILIKTGKGGTVVSGEDKSAIRHYAFRIDDVSKDILQRPFVRGISEISLIFLDAAEQIQCSLELLLEKLHDVVAGDFADIADLVIGQF